MATYVLIHGAYQGGWIWKPVIERLRAAGHRVYAPTLDGCAERHHLVRPGITVTTHAQEIAQLMFYEDLTQVVLVGTSSGVVDPLTFIAVATSTVFTSVGVSAGRSASSSDAVPDTIAVDTDVPDIVV